LADDHRLEPLDDLRLSGDPKGIFGAISIQASKGRVHIFRLKPRHHLVYAHAESIKAGGIDIDVHLTL
jgi:hypothetical protein